MVIRCFFFLYSSASNVGKMLMLNNDPFVHFWITFQLNGNASKHKAFWGSLRRHFTMRSAERSHGPGDGCESDPLLKRLGQISAVKRAALWHEREEEEEGPPPAPAHQSIISVHFEPVTGIPFQTELQTWVWGTDSLQNHTHGSNKGLYAVLMLSSIYAEVYIFKIDEFPECPCKIADKCTVTAQQMPYWYAWR